MNIVGMEISFLIHHAQSLKDKRSVVKSMIHKMHHKYNISIAEISSLDMINQGVIGISACGNSYTHCKNMLERVIQDIEDNYDIEIHHIETYEL